MVVQNDTTQLHQHSFQEATVLNPHLFFHGDDEFIIYGYAIPVLAGFSLLANCLIIRTLCYRRYRTTCILTFMSFSILDI